MKYTGHDIQQIEAKVEGEIKLSWGDDSNRALPGQTSL